jgi:AcrR family transcriptional regulator
VIDRILDGAEAVLREHGYAGFTTRRVAEKSGIAPGNLSYHYPSKLELLRAVIGRLVTRYSERLQAALQQPGLAPGPDVAALARWLLDDAVTEETVWLFRELWAMALRDEVIRNAVDDLYDEVMDRIATALQAAYPAADPQGLRDLVQFIALISEGSTVLYGTRRKRVTPQKRMVDLAVRVIGVISPQLAPAAAR